MSISNTNLAVGDAMVEQSLSSICNWLVESRPALTGVGAAVPCASGSVPAIEFSLRESAVESNRSGVDECEGSLSGDV